MKDVCTCSYRCRMRIVDVVNRQRDLYTRGRPPLRRIEGKMEVGTFSPGDFSVPSAYPPVVHAIVARMQIKTECVSVERHRAVEVGDLQDDCHQPTVFGHLRSLPNQTLTDPMSPKRPVARPQPDRFGI